MEPIEFNTNVNNIKYYFDVGNFDELRKYTNISGLIITSFLESHRNQCDMYPFFQDEETMYHFINNCNDLSKCDKLVILACKYSTKNSLELLIDKGAPFDNTKITKKYLYAAIEGFKKYCNCLICYDAIRDVNYVSKKKELLSFLLEKDVTPIGNVSGYSKCIILALIKEYNVEIINVLLDSIAKKDNAIEILNHENLDWNYDEKPLYHAICYGPKEVRQRMIDLGAKGNNVCVII